MKMGMVYVLFAAFFILDSAYPKNRNPKSEPQNSSNRLKASIESALPKNKSGLDIGIIVASLPSGEILYERNANELLIPASVNKIFTAYAALKKLKPNFAFKTTVHINNSVREGKLSGDLYIKGGGDPSLVSERLWMLCNEFIRSGIKVVGGDIVADSSFYDQVRTPESRPKYLKDQAYNSPIGALSFNFNTTTIFVRPAEKAGDPPVVYTDPANSYIDIVNQATTSKSGGKNTIQVSRTDYVKGDIGDTVLLRGQFPLDHSEMHFYKNIVNPSLYTAHMIKTFLEQRGIKVEGNVKEGEVPSGSRQILEFDSQPLWQIIWGMNKFSNNFVADQTLKRLGAEMWGPPGNMQKGITALEDVLEDIGIPKKSYHIEDGSGLTRATKVTAKQILTVLKAAHRDFSVFPEFIASLVIAGEDGTLKRRFPNTKNSILLRGKTGTLDGVSSLAGYAVDADDELTAFAIVFNDNKLKYGKMSGWVDQIATSISKHSKK